MIKMIENILHFSPASFCIAYTLFSFQKRKIIRFYYDLTAWFRIVGKLDGWNLTKAEVVEYIPRNETASFPISTLVYR